MIENRTVGPYRLIEEIGHGGMGFVHIAEHIKTHDRVALKTVKLLGERHLQGFRREIHALARIQHPGIVTILDHGIHHGLPWYAMELISGVTLRQWASQVTFGESRGTSGGPPEPTPSQLTVPVVDRHNALKKNTLEPPLLAVTLTSSHDASPFNETIETPPGTQPGSSSHQAGRTGGSLQTNVIVQSPIEVVLRMVQRICEPLAFLHGEGIIHRDLKPDNIIIREDGSPVILDFGLMHRFGGEMSRETLISGLDRSGTLAYMSPEQIIGQFVDARADLYALGCILFELLTGHRPFSGESADSIIRDHLFRVPDRPSTLRPMISRPLDQLVLELLEKDPRDRTGFALDVAASLNNFCGPITDTGQKPRCRTYLYRPRFTGRDAEYGLLKSQLGPAGEGRGGLVLITGESGLGKTRLLMELAREAEKCRFTVVSSICMDGQVRPLEAFRGLFHALYDQCLIGGDEMTCNLLGHRGKLLARYEPLLDKLPALQRYPEPVDLKQDAASLRLFSYLSDTIHKLVRNKPTVILMDDLHWADELSLGFLQFIAALPDFFNNPLLIVGTCRSEEIEADLDKLLRYNCIKRISIGRLSEDAVTEILGDMLAWSKPPVHFSRFLAEHTEGNPLFLAEILRSAIDEGLLWRDPKGHWQINHEHERRADTSELAKLPLPDTLNNLVLRRLQGLDETTRSVMNVAAILGRESLLTIVQTMSGLDEDEFFAAVSDLFRRQILEEQTPSTVRFTHARLRDITYETMLEGALPGLHRRAAETLEAMFPGNPPDYAAKLGYHWEMAGEHNRARIAYLAAAKAARDRDMLLETTRLLKKCHQLYPDACEASISIRIDIADLLHMQGKNVEAEKEMQKAIAESVRSGNRSLTSKALNHLGIIFMRTGKLVSAHRTASFSLQYYQTLGDEIGAINVMINLATIELTMGQVDQARERYLMGLELLGNPEDTTLTRSILGNLAILFLMQGNNNAALPLLEQALVLARQVDDQGNMAWLLGNLATVNLLGGNLEQAGLLFEEALRLQQKIGDRRLEGYLFGNIAITEYNRGNLLAANERYHHALTVFREIGDRRSEGIALGNCAELALAMGDLVRAESLINRAISSHREFGDKINLSHSMILLGRIRFLTGHPDDTEQLFRDTLEITRSTKDIVFEGIALCHLATITRLWHNDIAGARRLIDTAISILEKVNQPLQLSLALAEQGHIDLAEGKSAKSTIETLQKIREKSGIREESELGISISRLKQAEMLFQSNQRTNLFRGQANEDLPAFLSKKH